MGGTWLHLARVLMEKLTQGYIDKKHEELMGRLDESVVKTIVDRLQIGLELQRIQEELNSAGLEKNIMHIRESTCARCGGSVEGAFDRKSYQREYMREYRKEKARKAKGARGG